MLIGFATFKPFNWQLTRRCLGAVLSSPVCKHAQVSHCQSHLILVPVRAINKAYCELYCYIAKINQHSLFQIGHNGKFSILNLTECNLSWMNECHFQILYLFCSVPLLEYAPTLTPPTTLPPSPKKEEVDKKSIAYDFFNALSASH